MVYNKTTEIEHMDSKKIQINREQLNRQYGYLAIKRLFDIVASCLGVVVLSPVFLITAICIKINDPHGPVFYTQTRVGKDLSLIHISEPTRPGNTSRMPSSA